MSFNFNVFKKQDDKNIGKVHVLDFIKRENGGIKDTWVEKSAVGDDVLTWTVCGHKVKYRVYPVDDSGPQPVVMPRVVTIPPEKVGRIRGCLPRQQLNAVGKDLWEKIAPYAPIAAIGIAGLIFIIIMD